MDMCLPFALALHYEMLALLLAESDSDGESAAAARGRCRARGGAAVQVARHMGTVGAMRLGQRQDGGRSGDGFRAREGEGMQVARPMGKMGAMQLGTRGRWISGPGQDGDGCGHFDGRQVICSGQGGGEGGPAH